MIEKNVPGNNAWLKVIFFRRKIMKVFSIFVSLILLFSFAITSTATADTRYVGDQLVITLRQGKSSRHKIIKTLKTGTQLEVLEEDDSYLKVRTRDGLEGYVLRQYISTNPPKTHLISRYEEENSRLKNKINGLEKVNAELEAQIESIQKEHSQELLELTGRSTLIEEALEQIEQEQETTAEKYSTLLSQSENIIAITEERDQLLNAKASLSAELKSMRTNQDKLSDTRMIKWFLAGGGVLLFGWIIGRISRKKRSRY
jgi:SH3 domain protein